jgi:ABC-type protease/lipase transport system fused ATPase/permease subunit
MSTANNRAKSKSSRPQARYSQARERLTKGFRGIFTFVFSISGLINLLALTGSFYMMQIYDRAIPSQNVPTLLALSALAIGLYLFQGIFETIRSQIMVRVGSRLDKKLAPLAHKVAIDMPRFGFSTSEALERSRDVDTVRGFLGSQGPMALFDLPWMPLYLVFVYLLHPYLGALVIGGACLLTLIAIATELVMRKISHESQKTVMVRNAIADSNTRNAEVLRAMGFASRAVDRFTEANQKHIEYQTQANDISGTLGAVARILRMIMQSATLGLGAYLVIEGQMSGGAIIAASITSSRAGTCRHGNRQLEEHGAGPQCLGPSPGNHDRPRQGSDANVASRSQGNLQDRKAYGGCSVFGPRLVVGSQF